MTPLLYIVLPCFNNGEIIPFSVKFYKEKLEELSLCGKISGLSKILLIDNGSTDNTWERISEVAKKNPSVKGIRLGKYSGKTNALICGFENAERYADIVVAADCRCRKDINAIDRMINCYEKGSHIVLSAQDKPDARMAFKHSKSHRDFEYLLITKEIVAELSKYKEFEINIKNILLGMNYSCDCVYYKKRNTFAIKEKLSLKRVKEKFFAFFNMCFSPIHLLFAVGVFLTVIFSGLIIFEAVFNIFGKNYEIGKLILPLLASVDIMGAGITGEYLIKIINEIKKHPRYTVVDLTGSDNSSALEIEKAQDIV